jgi:hypothetical protein
MSKSNTVLLACWENEMDQLPALLKHNSKLAQGVDLVVFSEAGESLSSLVLPVEMTLITLPSSQFTQREPLLRAPSELALWLFDHAQHYQNILCSVQGGLVYFISRLNQGLNACSHWTVNTFSEATTRSDYQRTKRFLDKQGVLRDFLEHHWADGGSSEREEAMADISDASAVTVIMPFHNRVEFVAQALTSLLKQTVQGMQILIVNDGSDAQPRQALAQIISAEPFSQLTVQIIDAPTSSGAAGARNLGLSKVTTPFVLFIDDDDVFAPTAVKLCLEAQQRTNSDIVTMAFSYFDGAMYPDFSQTPGMLIHFHSDQDWVSALSYNCIGGISALYRTEVITRYGGFHCGPFAGEEDWQLLLKLAIAGCSHINLPLPLLWYRNTPFSLSKKMLHFDSRQQLFKLYEKVLPPQLHALPEYVTWQYQAQKSSGNEVPFARLGFQLGQCTGRPLYLYGAGNLGKQVMELLETLGMEELVVSVIDRNAAFIQTLNDLPVMTPQECKFVDRAVVIIASLSFVDDIISQLPAADLQVIRLDKL